MPMNVASIAHAAITLNYQQATLESLSINHNVEKSHFFNLDSNICTNV
jgi:hypothetical protein